MKTILLVTLFSIVAIVNAAPPPPPQKFDCYQAKTEQDCSSHPECISSILTSAYPDDNALNEEILCVPKHPKN
ncbi:hypothetical protein LRAMOSA09082 [Lichtheimia ramosa]|uniref:Extracellular membrane protein CFEM domain-containing protein n=1 Tax=Lichtheimia ramosa TaxID=688394 RepID=A0A077WHC8_9FUNG|nr:hypothetical protein LRAMOSA09082 [Lichtheimia ramosa]